MKFSVITVCMNARETIEDTILSVARQTHADREHIIIDGGSTDGTQEIIQRHADKIARWRSEPDKGIYDAMNKGLAAATGDYIGYLNADDFFAKPTSLESLARAAHSHPDVIIADLILVDQHNTDKIHRFYGSSWFRRWQMRLGHMPAHPTTYIRRGFFEKVGPFRTDLRIAGDFDMVSRALLVHRGHYVHVPETIVALRRGGISTQGFKATRRINREIHASLKTNGLSSHPALLWSRYSLKWLQWIQRPKDYPAKAAE